MHIGSTLERVRIVVIKELGFLDKMAVSRGSSFSSLGFDEFDKAELMHRFEDEFDIDIPEDDWPKLETVADVVKYADSRLD